MNYIDRDIREKKVLVDTKGRTIFNGRLSEYKYHDTDQVIMAALERSRKER